jgi:hypothetical protein
MKQNIYERRLNCLEFDFIGAKPSEWIPIIAAKYGVTTRAIRKDWSRRSIWMPEIQNQSAAKERFNELMVMMKTLIHNAYRLSRTANSSNIRIGSIRTTGDLIEKYFSITRAFDLEDLKRRIEYLEEVKGK